VEPFATRLGSARDRVEVVLVLAQLAQVDADNRVTRAEQAARVRVTALLPVVAGGGARAEALAAAVARMAHVDHVQAGGLETALVLGLVRDHADRVADPLGVAQELGGRVLHLGPFVLGVVGEVGLEAARDLKAVRLVVGFRL